MDHWMVTVALVTSSLVAAFANFLLLLVFCWRRGLRTISNRFTINLLLANFMSSISLVPLISVDRWSPERIHDGVTDSTPFCYAAQATVRLMFTVSIFSVLLIGIDQYFAVIHSLRYHFYIDKSKSLLLITTGWILSAIFASLGAVAQTDSHLWHSCPKKRSSSTYASIYFALVIVLPFLAICVIYVCIYFAAHHNSERMRKSKADNRSSSYASMRRTPSEGKLETVKENGDPKPAIPKVNSAPSLLHLQAATIAQTTSDRVGFITNLKCKLSNASVFRYREETRAAKISVLVIVMVLVCYIPYGVVILLNSDSISATTTPFINLSVLALLITSNLISPFLFAYRNRRIRRELARFLRKNGGRLSYVRCVPQVVVTLDGKASGNALKRSKNWGNPKKCSFIAVPESCWQTESARGSFSSASTQTSSLDD